MHGTMQMQMRVQRMSLRQFRDHFNLRLNGNVHIGAAPISKTSTASAKDHRL